MSKYRRTTASTLTRDLRAFADEIERSEWPAEARKDAARQLNRWLDELAADDAFGTEGQCDPRGDHRD